MELLILKGMMYDLTDDLASKVLGVLAESKNASFIGVVAEYQEPDEDEMCVAEDCEFCPLCGDDSHLRATITELAEERDHFKDLLSVADDKATFNDRLIAQYATESVWLNKHAALWYPETPETTATR